jgi:hypothetical protein
MLADPQSVTISGSAISLPRTSSGVNSGVYTSNDGSVKLSVSHQYGKRIRRTVRLEHSKIAPDPLAAANTKYSMTSYIVLDVPTVGYTVAEAKAVWDGFAAALAASTGALVSKVLGGEN